MIHLNLQSKISKIQAVIILFFTFWGISIYFFKESVLPFTSIFFLSIIIFTFITLFIDLSMKEKKNLSFLISLLILIPFIFLIIGIKTGKVFGYFVYTDILSFKLFDVPIVIALNWGLILLSSYYVSRNFLRSRWQKIIVGGMLVFFFDFIFELFAKKYQFWVWTDLFKINYIGIPLQNFLVWLILGFISCLIINSYKQKLEPRILITFWFSELFMFQILQLV